MSARSSKGDSFLGSGPTSWPPDLAPAGRKKRACNSLRRAPLPRVADGSDIVGEIHDADVGVNVRQEAGPVAGSDSGPSGTSGRWVERLRRRDDQWRAAIPELRASSAEAYLHAWMPPLKHGMSHLQGIRASVRQWGRLHTCCQREDRTSDQSCLVLVEQRPTTFIGRTCHGSFNVPLWECSKCKEVIKPNPAAFACFPSSPTAAAYWLDVELHHQYSRLALQEGISAKGTAHWEAFNMGLHSEGSYSNFYLTDE